MTAIDRLLQRIRARVALPHIPEGSRLLDVGCADGAFLRAAAGRTRVSMGIDPRAPDGDARLIRGRFPDDLETSEMFDVMTMLAVFEHIADEDRPRFVEACRRLLRPGGRVILTVPAPIVDRIVDALRALRLADGMDIESHHGYDPEETPRAFAGFRVVTHRAFELGLNHLYVLELPPATDA